eukprot:14358354-Alexandrium_andersonii.AAC.1
MSADTHLGELAVIAACLPGASCKCPSWPGGEVMATTWAPARVRSTMRGGGHARGQTVAFGR